MLHPFSKQEEINIAELLVQRLTEAGVRRIYGVCGDSLNAVTEALRRQEIIRWVHTRHEEAGAFAAGGEGQITGKLTACAGSCGPGNTHLINGLYDAQRSRVPMIALAAQIPTNEIGTGYFQETHPELIFGECSVYCETIQHRDQAERVIEIAIRTAIAKQGVAVIVLPGNIALERLTPKRPALSLPEKPSTLLPSASDVSRAAQALNAAKKVTILAGIGAAGARDALFAVADVLQAPIVHSLRGKEYLEHDNPYDAGLTGLIGFSAGYDAIFSCDALLMVGTDFPYEQFLPQGIPVIQIDERGEQIGKRVHVAHPVVGDAKATLEVLRGLLTARHDDKHLEKHRKSYDDVRKRQEQLASGQQTPMHPQLLAQRINDLSLPDTIFTCDVGTTTIWAARHLMMNGKRRLLGSFVHGSMASALPHAIGAQLAQPNRQVVSLSGDGGLSMLLGDLLSLKQLKLPVKVVVFNNGALGFVELEMKAAGFLDYGTELENPNFAQLAQSAGIHGIRVERPGDLDEALKEAFAYRGPVVLDVLVARQELAMPPKITTGQAVGFGLFALQAVVDGRGHELLEIAKTNVLR